MSRLKYCLLSMNVLNGLLAVSVAAVLYWAAASFMSPAVQIPLPPVKKSFAPSAEKMTPPLNSPPVDYAVISNQNLFHPERKIPPERQAEKTVPRPDVVLYGTLITGETSFAFLEDRKAPYSTAGRGKRQVALKKGDSLGGYILSEIEANRIVLLKGKDKITVMLDDKGKRRGEETPTSPAAARTPLGGVAPSQPLTSSPPPTAPSSVQSVPSPGKATGIPGPVPSSAQPAPSSRPGSGASGSWPPTRSTIEQTQQKIREGQHMRSNQIQQN